jgi:hypothetical protein
MEKAHGKGALLKVYAGWMINPKRRKTQNRFQYSYGI